VDAVSRSEARVRAVLAAVLPALDAQADYTRRLRSDLPRGDLPPVDAWSIAGSLGWDFFDLRAFHAHGTARRAEDAAKAELAEVQRTIVRTVATALLATLAADRAAELNRVGLRATLERLELTLVRNHLGGGTALDLDRARQDVAAARSLLVSGDEALRQSWEALALALGSEEPLAGPGDLDLTRFEQAVTATCGLQQDLERRPDVASAQLRVELAERAVEEVRLQLAPTIALQSRVARSAQALEGPDTTWTASAVAKISLWDGGARQASLRDALAALDQARQNLAAARMAALVDIAQSTRAVGTARRSRELAQEQRDLAAGVDRLTREGYRQGLGTSLDLITSAQALRQAEINLVVAQFQESRARLRSALANATCFF
jgi:outer membrane protein TolC